MFGMAIYCGPVIRNPGGTRTRENVSSDRGLRSLRSSEPALGTSRRFCPVTTAAGVEGKGLVLQTSVDHVPGVVQLVAVAAMSAVGRIDQVATAGRLTTGSSLKGAMASNVM